MSVGEAHRPKGKGARERRNSPKICSRTAKSVEFVSKEEEKQQKFEITFFSLKRPFFTIKKKLSRVSN